MNISLKNRDKGKNTFKSLFDDGYNFDSIEEDWTPPLQNASSLGSLKLVKRLLIKGKNDIEVEDEYGDTPLLLASMNGHIEVVKFLVENGADLNHKNKLGENPLLLASNSAYIEIVKFLIEKGADLEAKSMYGKLFYEIFSMEIHRKEIDLLLKDLEEKKRMIKPCKK